MQCVRCRSARHKLPVSPSEQTAGAPFLYAVRLVQNRHIIGFSSAPGRLNECRYHASQIKMRPRLPQKET